MKSYNAGRLIAEKMKMSERSGQHVVLCPFHSDNDKSFSLDLDKGVFYCHGGCDEPKGGSVVEFLVKWARIVDQKPITRDEARRLLHRGGSIPNARQLRQDMLDEELRLFARLMLHVFADALKQIERSLEYGRKMSILKIDCHLHALIEWCFDVCLASSVTLHPSLLAVYETAKAYGWWSLLEAQKIQRESRRYVRRLRALDRTKTRRTIRTPIPSKGTSCRAIQSTTSPKKRHPVSLRTPIMSLRTPIRTSTTTTRQPIPSRQPV